MAAPCPACGTEVDPLRAPAVRVLGGKITAYCSNECAAGLPKVAHVVALPAPTAAPKLRRTTAPSVVDATEPPALVLARPRRRRLVLWLTAGIIAGGMAVAIVQAVSPSTPTPVEARTPPPAPDAGPDASPSP